MKLNGYYHIRNECVILGLLKKYCTARNIHFEFQQRCGTAVFDAVIGRRIAIKFDEPHHVEDVEQGIRDKAKDAIATVFGLTVLRFTIVHDIVDVILAVEAGFKALSAAAQHAGVQDATFGVFHDAGYKGLHGGLDSEAIKARKRIEPREQLMDRMDTTELAANQFRMTQTRERLARKRVRDQQQAIQTHQDVGREVRNAIMRIGGMLPENIAPAEHIKEVEKRFKTATPKLELDDHDAKRAARKVPYRLLDPVEQVGDPSASNLLIQGDNLEALKALLPFYAGRGKACSLRSRRRGYNAHTGLMAYQNH